MSIIKSKFDISFQMFFSQMKSFSISPFIWKISTWNMIIFIYLFNDCLFFHVHQQQISGMKTDDGSPTKRFDLFVVQRCLPYV